MFKDILTFLGLYWDDTPITLDFVVLEISKPKIRSIE